MHDSLRFTDTDTAKPSASWIESDEYDRKVLLESVLSTKLEFEKAVLIVKAKADGQVIVSLLEPLSADKRGTFLLDLEAFLKVAVDPGIVIWLDALGDKSSLRNLRGIEVKG